MNRPFSGERAAFVLALALCAGGCGPQVNETPAHVAGLPSAAPAPPAPPPASASAVASAQAPEAPEAARAPAEPETASPPADLGREGCKRGAVAGCDELAEYWGAREFLPKTHAEAAASDGAILKEACDGKGISSACMGYALMLKYGTATGARDGAAAKPYWQRVRELRDLNGYRGEPASDEGREVLGRTRAECDAGRTRSCNQLGWAAYNAVVRKRSIPDAFKAYERSCRLGSSQGCHWSGHFAHVYEDVRNLSASERLLRRGCEGQNPGSCRELGMLLLEKKDRDGARAVFESACAEGSRAGCTQQALLLWAASDGRARAREMLEKQCELEDDSACGELGKKLDSGDGVKRDSKAALGYYQRGCQAKDEGACAAVSHLVGGDRPGDCALKAKSPRVDPKTLDALRDACKKKSDAPWCVAIVSCP